MQITPHDRLMSHVSREVYTYGRPDFDEVFRPVQVLHTAGLVDGLHPH